MGLTFLPLSMCVFFGFYFSQATFVFSFPPEPHLFNRFWPFSEAKVKFSGSQIFVKYEMAKNYDLVILQRFLNFKQFFGQFSEAKVKYLGSQILVKNHKKLIFFKLSNFPFWSISKWTTKSTFLEMEFFPSICPYIRSLSSGEMVLAVFSYRSEKRKT